MTVVGAEMPPPLSEWGCDAALWKRLPLGACRDLTRFAGSGEEELARRRLATMREILEMSKEPSGTWQKETWDEAVATWEAAKAAEAAAAAAAAKEAKKAAAKAAREAAAAADQAAAAAAEEAAAKKTAQEEEAKKAAEAVAAAAGAKPATEFVMPCKTLPAGCNGDVDELTPDMLKTLSPSELGAVICALEDKIFRSPPFEKPNEAARRRNLAIALFATEQWPKVAYARTLRFSPLLPCSTHGSLSGVAPHARHPLPQVLPNGRVVLTSCRGKDALMHYVMGRSKEHCMTGYLAAKAPLSSSRVRLPSGALTDLLPSPPRLLPCAGGDQALRAGGQAAARLSPHSHTSPYLPISPHISPYLPISPHLWRQAVKLQPDYPAAAEGLARARAVDLDQLCEAGGSLPAPTHAPVPAEAPAAAATATAAAPPATGAAQAEAPDLPERVAPSGFEWGGTFWRAEGSN